MAAGISLPITLDISDIPKSVAAAKKDIKKLEREFGKLNLTIDGKPVKDLAAYSKDATKGVKGMAAAISKAQSSLSTLQTTMQKIRKGKGVGTSVQAEIGTFAKSARLIENLGLLETRRTELLQAKKGAKKGDAGNLKEAQAEYNRVKRNTLALLEKEAAGQQNVLNKMRGKIQMEGQLKINAVAIVQQRERENKAIQLAIQKQRVLRAAGKQDMRDRLEMHELFNRAKERGIKLSKRELAMQRQIAHETKKARGSGPAAMIGGFLRGRGLWFLWLRILWDIYRVIGLITGQLTDLDEAIGRSMRTMRVNTESANKALRTRAGLEAAVQEKILEVGRNTGAQYKEIGEGLYQLSSAGLSAKDALAGLNTVMRFATITETSTTDASKLLAGAMNNYKEMLDQTISSTEQMAQISGTLTYVWERNQIDMNEMVQGLNQSVNSAKLANLEFGELAVIVGNLGTMMIRSGRGGRSLRTAITQMASKGAELGATFDFAFDPSKPLDFVEIMDKMHESFSRTEKTAAVTDKIFKIFGKRGAPAILALLRNWEKVRKEIDGVGDGMELMINEQEKLLRLQERHRLAGKTVWNEITASIAESFNYMELYRKGLNWILNETRTRRAAGRVKMGEEFHIDTGTFADSGAAAEEYAFAMAKVNTILEKMSTEEKSRFGKGSPLEGELKIWEDYVVMLAHVRDRLKEVEEAKRKEGETTEDLTEREKELLKVKESKREVLIRLGALEGYETSQDILKALRYEKEELADVNLRWQAMYDKHGENKELMKSINKELADQTKKVLDLQKAYNDLYEQNKVHWLETLNRNRSAGANVITGGAEKGGAVAARRAGGRAGGAVPGGFNISPAMQGIQNAEAQRNLQHEIDVSAEKYRQLGEIRNLGYEQEQDRQLTVIQQQREMLELKQQELLIEQAKNEAEQARIDAAFDRMGTDPTVDPDQLAKDQENLNSKVAANTIAQESIRNQMDLTKMKEEELDGWREKAHGRMMTAMKEQGVGWTLQGAIVKAYGQDVADAMGQGLENLKFVLAEAGKESKAAWDAYKAIAIAQTIVKTYESAQSAYAAVSWIPGVGPFLGVALAAAAITAGIARVNAIRSQKPEGKAKGGVFDGTFIADGDSYATGGVTSGVARGIIGDNPSGKELVIPSEHIKKNYTEGYVREQDEGGGGGAPTIVNVLTEQDIAGAMATETGGNVIVNRVVQNSEERKEVFRTTREVAQGKTPGKS